MHLQDVMRTTPATRSFTNEPVSTQTVRELLDLARFAPNGGNRQVWHVTVLEDAEVRARICELYVLGWREYMAHLEAGLVAFAPDEHGRWAGPAIDLERARAVPSPNPFADHIDEAPVLLLVTVDLSRMSVVDNGLDRQSITGGASVYPFVHNLLLAARDRGLGGVMTTVLVRQEPAVRELLGIPDGHAVASLVAIGHPTSVITKLTRAPVDDFTTVDHFDGPPLADDGARG